MKHAKKSTGTTVAIIGALIVIWLFRGDLQGLLPENDSSGTSAASSSNDDAARIRQAFLDEASGLMVTAIGDVAKTLSDDTDGSQHQRFIVRLSNGHTILVAHNIDLAPRVPLTEGDLVTIRGQFEWNADGGVVHWTHHDPRDRREGGWIEHDGRRYE